MLAPAALSLLTTTFTEPAERGKAFGIYAAIAGMGGAIGLLLGGALTELLDWRWCLYVSIVFAAAGGDRGARACCTTSPAPDRPRLDVPGALTASTGLFALVFGLSRAETDGWGDPVTIGLPGRAAPCCSSAFVALAAARRAPAAAAAGRRRPRPRRVVPRDRHRQRRACSAVFLFLTFYLQNTKGLSALETGLAFLPMSFSIAPDRGHRQHARAAPHRPAAARPGRDAHAPRSAWCCSRASASTPPTPSHVLPSLILIGIGFGLTLAPSFATATHGVPAHDSGVASAMVNTSQQIGGSIGTALLSTLGAGSLTTAYWWAGGLWLGGALVVGALFRTDTRPAVAHATGRGRAAPDAKFVTFLRSV